MSDEQRLENIESRLDRVAATNVGLRETIVRLQDQISANRVEILALHYLAERRLPPRPAPAAQQDTGSLPPLPPAAIQVPTNRRTRPRIPVRDATAPPLQLGPNQSPRSSVTTPPSTLRDEINLFSQVESSIAGRNPAGASTTSSARSSTPFPPGSHVTIQRGKTAKANANKIFSVVGPKGDGGNYSYLVDVSTDGNSEPIYRANTSLSLAVQDEE